MFANAESETGLRKSDVMSMFRQVERVVLKKNPAWQALCSSKQARLMIKIAESKHEKKLDIRSFFRVQTDLSILLRLLLSKE